MSGAGYDRFRGEFVLLAVGFWLCTYLIHTVTTAIAEGVPDLLRGTRGALTLFGAILYLALLAWLARAEATAQERARAVISSTILAGLLLWAVRFALDALDPGDPLSPGADARWATLWSGSFFVGALVGARVVCHRDCEPTGGQAVDGQGARSTKLRIAYVVNSYVPSRAANTVHVLNMAAAFSAAEAEVTLIARAGDPIDGDVLKEFGIERSFRLELAPKRRPGLLDKLSFAHFVRRTLRQRPVDFAYGRSAYGLLLGVPRSIPVSYDTHQYPSGRRLRLEARLFSRPNFLFATAISRALAEQYEANYPMLRGRVLVAPCAASVPDVAPAVAGGGPLRVFYVGNLYAGRGVDLVLAMAARMPEVEFHVVGGEEDAVAALSATAPANVTFHGYVTPSGLAAHYAAADVCLAPYQKNVTAAGGRGDTGRWMSPMKVFEYMAHGKPIVASDLPVLREVLTSEVNSLLCEPTDVEAWCRALARLAEDPALRARLGEAGRREAEEKYNWKARAEAILGRAKALIGS